MLQEKSYVDARTPEIRGTRAARARRFRRVRGCRASQSPDGGVSGLYRERLVRGVSGGNLLGLRRVGRLLRRRYADKLGNFRNNDELVRSSIESTISTTKNKRPLFVQIVVSLVVGDAISLRLAVDGTNPTSSNDTSSKETYFGGFLVSVCDVRALY